jgi:glycosyltransferase involved in cell wall biosynthesis
LNLSVTIITFNEEKNIERCIASVQSIADEIIVVDSFSTDATKEICLKLGVTFIENKFEGHIQQKNFAISLTNNDFVLSLDADEALSDRLKQSIDSIKHFNNLNAIYSFNRITSYCGKWIKHCGWYPDKKIRLWNKKHGKWGGVNPHDKVIYDESFAVIHLEGDLLHYSFESIESHVQTANNFSTIAAKEAFKNGKKANVLIHVVLNPIYTFINKYFFRLGILDGFHGFVICYLSAVSNFLKYSKIRQLNNNGR